MGLDISDRGELEKIIDVRIKDIPKLLSKFRHSEIKSRYQITNPEEFCYGNMHGIIFGEFTTFFTATHGISVPDDELDEISEIIEKRSREIRNAIFNCG